ncbi:MAG: acyl carrier protein [Saprospiraceae bacterium]|nr:acyl carrier protein [Saprospiraceae bacterium]
MSIIKDKVVQIIVDKLGVGKSEISDTSNFTSDLGADSLDTVELIMEFEKEFSISIPDEDAEKILTVGNAIEYLEANSPKNS